MNDRLLRIMEAVVAMGPTARARDIAARLELPQATAYRLLSQLEELGLLERQEPGYRLGARLLRLALGAVSQESIRSVLDPELTALAAETGETAFATRLTASGVDLFISRMAAKGQHGGVLPPNGLRPAVCSGAKAIYAYLPEPMRAEMIEAANQSFPDLPWDDMTVIQAEISNIVRTSLATCFGEEDPDIGSFATPVKLRGQRGHLSIGIVGPRQRIERNWPSTQTTVLRKADIIADTLAEIGVIPIE